LEPAGIDLRTKQASFCEECLNRLKIGKLPPLALANNMWIGAVPLELSVLTLAECLLISMYFPTAYVFKLYPKHTGSASWDPSQLYDGMKGNVSTYPLDPALVADMIDGKLFPMPPKILCCTVAVTFITPSGQHMKGLPVRGTPYASGSHLPSASTSAPAPATSSLFRNAFGRMTSYATRSRSTSAPDRMMSCDVA